MVIKIKDIAHAAVDHGENLLKEKNNHNYRSSNQLTFVIPNPEPVRIDQMRSCGGGEGSIEGFFVKILPVAVIHRGETVFAYENNHNSAVKRTHVFTI